MSTARSVKRVYEALSRTQHGTKVPSVLKETQQNLYEVLARLPESGKGVKVHQTRWSTKGFNNCYYEVTHAETKNEGKNGRAWGIPVWMGTRKRQIPEPIPGGLKYNWKQGVSTGTIERRLEHAARDRALKARS